jgi:hypothetical protein
MSLMTKTLFSKLDDNNVIFEGKTPLKDFIASWEYQM